MDKNYYVIKMCHCCTFRDSHWRQKSNLSSLTRYHAHIQLNEAWIWPDAIIQCLLRYRVTDAVWATSERSKRNHHYHLLSLCCNFFFLIYISYMYELKQFSNLQQMVDKWGECDMLLRWRQLTTPSTTIIQKNLTVVLLDHLDKWSLRIYTLFLIMKPNLFHCSKNVFHKIQK